MRKTTSGFTLVELLIVIVVIAIIAAVSVVAYNGIQARAQMASVQSDWANAAKKLELFQVDRETYPDSIGDCPTPAANNLCLSASGDNTFLYKKIPAGTVGYVVSPKNQGWVAVMGKDKFLYKSTALITGSNEFTQYVDIAPFIDKYGLKKYTIEFDIKSANISQKNTIHVYQQNGSTARYGNLNVDVPVTTDWNRRSVTFTPTMNNSSAPQSMLAFYGTYSTGNIPSIQNLTMQLAN